jgi:putative spermidine/putrescine transport system permease protein
MNGRLLDDGLRIIGLVMIGTIICFLLTPIIVTTIMAFDSRAYLGPLPPPSLSFRWFEQFFSDDYFLRGLIFPARKR